MGNDKSSNKSVEKSNILSDIGNYKYLLLIPLIFFIYLLYQYSTSTITILPHNKNLDVKITKQLDYDSNDTTVNIDSNKTVTRIDSFVVTDSSAFIKFQLGNYIEYPYAGIIFHTFKDTTDSIPFNLSKMDYLEFDIEAKGDKREVNIYFSEFLENYTKFDKDMSWRTFEHQIAAKKGLHHYKISLDEFKTDSWWFTQQSLEPQELPQSTKKKIINLIFENGEYETKNVPISFYIKNVKFKKDLTQKTIIVMLVSLLYYIIFFIIAKLGIKKVMGPVVIPYKQLDVSSYVDEDTKKIEEYVANNYTDPDLSVKKLCSETGITHAKVQVILKQKHQLTFRQYLNKIKVHEAKRLLSETDRQVTDIAYRVGYKNVTHFNRIFKEMEGISPNQYRKSTK